jgi:type I restriction enzyme, S subunit
LIEDLKPHSRMKDSGSPWLGEVREHWAVQRLRNLTDVRVSNVDKHTKEGEQPVRLCNYLDVYRNHYIRPSMSLMRATATTEEIERFRLSEGDVLITKDSEAWNDIGVPALVRESADDLVSGYHLALLRPCQKRIAGEFLFRSLQSAGVQYQFHVEANGVTRYGLSHAAIRSVWLPVPPLPEQAAIVRFLDHADGRIRRYIRAKQKLIKLLDEQRRAIIHRAVTRGLDPNVRVKPSGVDWLGHVPAHWEVLPIKRAFVSMDYGISESATNEGTIRLLTMGHIRAGRVRVPNDGGVATVDPSLLLEADDLLFNRTNSAELVGKVGLFTGAESPVTFASYLVRMRPRRDNDPTFLNLLLNDYIVLSAARREAIPSLHQANLNPTRYGRLRIALPALSEQRAIVAFLQTATAGVEKAAVRTEREIDLLREYRTRLIADVVTGKLDVREAATRLPKEADDLEPLDETEAESEAQEIDAGATDDEPEDAEA